MQRPVSSGSHLALMMHGFLAFMSRLGVRKCQLMLIMHGVGGFCATAMSGDDSRARAITTSGEAFEDYRVVLKHSGLTSGICTTAESPADSLQLHRCTLPSCTGSLLLARQASCFSTLAWKS